MTKVKILVSSYGSAVVATLIGLVTAVCATSIETISRSLWAAGIFGVFSITSFFIGVAYPNAFQTEDEIKRLRNG